MSRAFPTCREIRPELVAVGSGEGTPRAARLVEEHVAECPPCREELRQYHAIEGMVADLRRVPLRGADPALARAELESRLADLRSRLVAFGIFPSSLGPLLIARSGEGVSMVEYLESEVAAASRIRRLVGRDAVEDATQTEAFYRDLLEYLGGRRTRLDWPLDLRWAS
ncbi:MAG TPA: zf-HC2 domain-containing protein, partial [Candidatus Methylomirabilis sp.]|nr:zf-HC2 domain-containing protein [Candidatus Methylomirabilis sp.]